MIRLLLDAGADPTARKNKTIREAAKFDNVEALILFQAYGTRLTGQTVRALSTAAAANCVATVRYLLTLPGLPAPEINLAAALALRNGHRKSLSLLLAGGAKLALEELAHLVAQSNSVRCLRLVQAHGYKLEPLATKMVYHAVFTNSGRIIRFIFTHWHVPPRFIDALLGLAVHTTDGKTFKLLLKHAAHAPKTMLSLFNELTTNGYWKYACTLAPFVPVESLAQSDVATLFELRQWDFISRFFHYELPVPHIQFSRSFAKKFLRKIRPIKIFATPTTSALTKDVYPERVRFAVKMAQLANQTPQISLAARVKIAFWVLQILEVKTKILLQNPKIVFSVA